MPAGGYQKPSRPAAASGPGGLSKRTDKGQPVRQLPNAEYGEQAEYQTAQQAAPMSKAAPLPSSGGGGGLPAGGAPPMTGMGEPTTRLGEAVTTGADVGPGAGSASLGLPDPNADVKMRLMAIYTQFPTEDLRELLEAMD